MCTGVHLNLHFAYLLLKHYFSCENFEVGEFHLGLQDGCLFAVKNNGFHTPF